MVGNINKFQFLQKSKSRFKLTIAEELDSLRTSLRGHLFTVFGGFRMRRSLYIFGQLSADARLMRSWSVTYISLDSHTIYPPSRPGQHTFIYKLQVIPLGPVICG